MTEKKHGYAPKDEIMCAHAHVVGVMLYNALGNWMRQAHGSEWIAYERWDDALWRALMGYSDSP